MKPVSYNSFFDYSAIVDRPIIKWPDGARVALWVSPNVEFYEYQPPVTEYRKLLSEWGRVPVPDVLTYAYRDYGNRVGFWRLLEVLDHFRIRATVSLNVAVLDHFPEIRQAMVARNWDYMSHGIYNTRYLFGMGAVEEREFFRDCIATVKRYTGKQLKGSFGPAATITPNTMNVMAREGLIYSCDWYIDDQPVPLNVDTGRLVSVPYSWEINDGIMITYGIGRYEADYFLQACKDQFDVLYAEGAHSGRVMNIALHPYVFGAPHRVKYLEAALAYILGHEGVWLTTADEIADYYLSHYYDQMTGHLGRSSANPVGE